MTHFNTGEVFNKEKYSSTVMMALVELKCFSVRKFRRSIWMVIVEYVDIFL